MKKIVKNYSLLFIVAVIVVSLDQYTKYLVRQNLELWTGTWAPWDWMLPYARIMHIPNTGVAFGMFQGLGGLFKFVPIIVAVIIIYYFPRVPQSDWPLRLAMSLQVSGAIGNWIDRLTIGYVTDFISIGNFAVFNIADSSITIGVIVLIVGVWITENQEKKKKEAEEIEHNEIESEVKENI